MVLGVITHVPGLTRSTCPHSAPCRSTLTSPSVLGMEQGLTGMAGALKLKATGHITGSQSRLHRDFRAQ